jgi:hypothetical protein
VKLHLYSVLLLTAALELRALEAHGQNIHDARLDARSHFQAGMVAAENGDLTAALSEFEAAYARQPHFSVLYNIGRARAGLGQHVEAIAAFERYLLDGGPLVDAARRAEVRVLIDTSHRQVGTLKLIVPSDSTRVWVDGRELDRREVDQPVRLSIGPHSLIHWDRGASPLSQMVEIRPASISEISLRPAPAATALRELRVHCNVPNVEVFVDGVSYGHTPFTSALSVPAGALRMRFVRPGYKVVERHIEGKGKGNGALVENCDQEQLPRLPAHIEACLKLGLDPLDAAALVDGKNFNGSALPSGPHDLSVTRDGFLPMRKRIVLSAQRITEYVVALKPTPSHEARRHASVHARHRVVYALASASAALLAASVGIYVWNGNRYDDWRSSQQRDLDRAVSIQRFDDLALGLLLLGAGTGIGGAWLYLGPSGTSP